MHRTTSHGRIAAGALAALLVALLAPNVAVAAGSQASSARGAALLDAVQSRSQRCQDLSRGDFATIGEYTMGSMIGSARGHEAMDRVMSTMMGAGSERRVHEVMGHRFAGCGGARLPGGFGPMMGAVNAMGMMGGGMMGGYPGASRSGNTDDSGPSAAAMLGVIAVLIGAVALPLLWLSRRRPAGPLELLQQRFARGDLTADQYQERKRLLEGSR